MPKVTVQCDVRIGPPELVSCFMELERDERNEFWSMLNHKMQHASLEQLYHFLNSVGFSLDHARALIASRKVAAEAER